MRVQDFLDKTIAKKGVHCVTLMGNNSNGRPDVFKDVVLFDAIADHVEYANSVELALFTSLGSLSQGWHDAGGKRRLNTQANTFRIKSLFLDIDCGAKHKYADENEAVEALLPFMDEVGLPVPTIVGTGGGLHVYFSFYAELTPERWLELAKLLARCAEHFGLDVDKARTLDYASQPRLPGSYNYKYTPPRIVTLEVLGEEIADVELDRNMRDYLERHGCVEVVPERQRNTATYDGPKPSASAIVAGCQQISNQVGASEPRWRGMIVTLSHCEGGRDIANELSMQDERYSEASFEAKYDEAVMSGSKPYTCETLRGYNPSLCEGCPSKGKIHSPISLGVAKQMKAKSSEPAVFESRQFIIKQGDSYDTHGVFFLTKRENEDGDVVPVEQQILEFVPVYNGTIIDKPFENNEVEYYAFITFKPHAGRDIDLEVKLRNMEGQPLRSALAASGITFSPKAAKRGSEFMWEFMHQMKNKTPEVEPSKRLGADRKAPQFLLGDKVYDEFGGVERLRPRSDIYKYAMATIPSGTFEGWKAVADMYAQPGMEWAQAVIASNIAAPFMAIWDCGIEAVCASLLGKSGNGKTAVQRTAAAIWGNPSEMLGLKADSVIGRYQRMGRYNNVPVHMDEMTDLTPREIADFAYQCTQGRAKEASNNNGTERANPFRWRTVVTLSSNTSQIGLLVDKGDSEAQIRRVFEMDTWSLMDKSKYSPGEAGALLGSLNDNHGVLGHTIIREMMSNKAKYRAELQAIQLELIKKHKLANEDRFYTLYTTLVIFGCKLGKQLGAVDYDVDAVEKFLIAQLRKLSAAAASEAMVTTTKGLYDLFLNDTLASQLTVLSDVRPKKDGCGVDRPINKSDPENDAWYVVGRKPDRELWTRICQDTDIAYTSTGALQNWCKKNKHSYSKLLDELRAEGRLFNYDSQPEKKDLGAGTTCISTRPRCIKVKLFSDTGVTPPIDDNFDDVPF